MSFRAGARAALDMWHGSRSKEVGDEELRADAWIIAPHQDDEVLGCGGTIARKVRLGARVRVCFLTDGSAALPQLISGPELKALRRREALTACAALGVRRGDVTFLDFADGKLAEHLDEATTQLRDCFERHPSIEVYAPHHDDGPLDHRAACWIARAAMQNLKAPSVLLEYPVWRWNYWPWVEAAAHRRRVRTAADAALGLARSVQLLGECRWRVPIKEVRDQKRRALESHRSQIFGLDGVENCPTLKDVGRGEFLKRFLATHEVFARYEGATLQRAQWPDLKP